MSQSKNLSTNNVIEKSKDLVWAKFKDWDAGELKLLEVYLSKINPREPEGSTVVFTMKEYGELLGLSHLQYEQASRLVTKFVSKAAGFEQEDSKGRKKTVAVPLFYSAVCEMDDKLHQYVIRLRCHPDLEPLFFNIADRKYIKYRLRNTVKLKSQYSITLYSLLLDSKGNPQGWSPTIEELKDQLGVTSDWYKSFRAFRQDILDKAVKEINEVTDLNVDYAKGMKGRKCTSIRFIVTSKAAGTSKNELEEPKGTSIDYTQYIPCMGAGAINAGKRLKKDIHEFYPEIPMNKIDDAVADVLKAVQAKMESLEEWPKNEGGYAWTIMFGKGEPTEENAKHRKELLDELIPGTYFPLDSYFKK